VFGFSTLMIHSKLLDNNNENKNLIENKLNQLPYLKFNTNFL